MRIYYWVVTYLIMETHMWTKEDEKFIIDNPNLTIKEISEKLNRKYTAVQSKITRMKIKKTGHKKLLRKIKELDITYLQDLVKNSVSYNSLACKLNVKNTKNFIKIIKSFNFDVSHFNCQKYINLIGSKINQLEILDVIQEKMKYFKVKCFCGNIFKSQAYSILNGATKSCGCYSSKFTAQKTKGANNPKWKGYEEIHGKYWSSVKNGAKKRNLEFSISVEDVWNLYIKQNRKCAMSDIPISFYRETFRDKQTASIDRIDSSKGYTIDNIQIVYNKINIMKQNYNINEFIKICGLIADKYRNNIPVEHGL